MRKLRLVCILTTLCTAAGLSTRGEAQGAAPRRATPLEVIPAILDAFRTHRIVSYPGGHTDGNEVHAQLTALIRDPSFATTVNDIVVEFGSSRYQDLMDRYIRGDDVSDAAIRVAWLNAVQGGTALENANTAAFFRNVRDVNAALPPERKLRVLLGDPPMDWDNIRNKADYRKWIIQRDSYPAHLVQREVLAHGRASSGCRAGSRTSLMQFSTSGRSERERLRRSRLTSAPMLRTSRCGWTASRWSIFHRERPIA